MPAFHRETYKVSDIIRWDKEGALKIQPKFQRRSVWELDARQYLMDTIIKNFPMPKVYLRILTKRKPSQRIYEVVDGQQRLRAILDFYKSRFPLSNKYTSGYHNKTFDQLPDPVQRNFLQYEMQFEIIESASDRDIWGLFERLNTYTVTLNRQEKLNAEFFGPFKRTCYRLAAEQASLNAWKGMKIFSDRQITRMAEVELTSDVIVALLHGISDITRIKKAYKRYDGTFTRQRETMTVFRDNLAYVRSHLGETIKDTRFNRKTWFYSLLVAVIDARHGIETGYGRRDLQPLEEIRERMLSLNSILTPSPVELPQSLVSLHQSLSRQTSHVRPRSIRHEYFYDLLTLSRSSWEEKLQMQRPTPIS